MAKTNLDAIIPREDFEVVGTQNSTNLFNSISITSITSGLFYPFLRKPDFQRETNEWDAKKIAEFIESFINGELIPAIILWRNNAGLYFVIDGAHRLSALISWIKDDYGDGEISKKFYGDSLSDDQKEIAERTRKLINKKMGKFQDIANATNADNPDPAILKKAMNLGAYSIDVQWVNGDAQKAEKSFFKINQQPSKIDPTEFKILESRKKGNCIAARAIIRAGEGHKYWSDFSANKQSEIQIIAKEIHEILFNPTLKTPVKTLDIPIGGKVMSAQALPLILEYVNMVNKIGVNFADELQDDQTGDSTLSYLKNARKLAWRINSVHPSSLGLHPIVYFYSIDGKHKPASFYFTLAFILELERKGKFNDFIKVRAKFEEFILNYDYLIQQITRKYRSAFSAIPHVTDFYMQIIKKLLENKTTEKSIEELVKEENFKYLILNQFAEHKSSFINFTTETKSEIFIREALKIGLKCKICNGYIHKNSISIDHIQRVEDGGKGEPENGQLTHPYCNTTFKN
ncbi:DUF262 domain-containing protein [Sphingobacterium sp. UT-1RO-CII-1]|uniref:GmrSD restriction endonuclease domain-containing protein n=1 Tax=Sphingobacterium sp. UT-1RO-CII-1 TaxID=2995225 RepID=UPI00227C89DD|nr:DUF262 domain-containing protein [Sphingobacterium sp. UT-1RO-CII-1]MCY4780353.1 DUF262 domain-containing protein [Sphingobacterium sp. UT-1RO-CII-1]